MSAMQAEVKSSPVLRLTGLAYSFLTGDVKGTKRSQMMKRVYRVCKLNTR